MKNVKSILGFKITSFNKVTRMCNLTVVSKPVGKKEISKNFKGVEISALLLSNLLEPKQTNVQEGVYYESDIDSPEYKENPFQLIKYRKEDGTIAFLLTMVFQRENGAATETDPFGNTKPNYQYHNKNHFLRYRNRVSKVTA